uniref:receptor protein-tyrosine kinase n=1 Tax=Panagrellus redivivus TaxID=6233 RepID=A0A7E4VGM9_PANRE
MFLKEGHRLKCPVTRPEQMYRIRHSDLSSIANFRYALIITYKLLVAFQHGEHEFGTTENYICSYNFTDLKMMFSKTWKKCQKLSTPLSSKDCQGQYDNLNDECYLFSWDNPNSHKQCSAYDEEKTGNAEIDNCNVQSNATKPYGSLENFKPYVGKTLFSEIHTEPIVAIQKVPNDGTLYALRKDRYIIQSSKKISTPAKIVRIKHVETLSIWTIAFWVLSAVCLFVAVCCYFVICITQRRATRYMSWTYSKPRANDYQRVIPLKAMADQLNPNKLIVLNTQPLGSGNSATVYKGSYKTNASEYEHVAAEVFNDEYAALLDTEKLIDELKVLRQIQHSNIVAFIGHTYIDRTLHIVTEYMAGGSLYDYIQNENTALKYQHTFDHMDQILSAMVYLTQQQIVHRDLAARNCLLNKDHTVLKVSDFGLARSVDFKGEYQILHIDTALPTRWIALEAFSQLKFTEKTDVWLFGVLVWELFTRGNIPYFPLDHYQIITFLNEGRRLQCPKTCPDQIYALIITCWDSDPEKRPTFKQLQKNVKDVVQQLTSANKHLTETEYERPRQPLTHFDKATTEKDFVRKVPLLL